MDTSRKEILIRTKVLLERLPGLSQTTISFWIRTHKAEGRDLREMGLYQIKGSRYDLWNLNEFLSFLETEKLNVRPPNTKVKKGYRKNHEYSHDKIINDRIRQSVLVVKQQSNSERSFIND